MTIKKLSDLHPAEYNPRKIKDKALEGLKYSIEEFGDISGITFNVRTGNLVCAHQRKKALELNGDDYNIEITERYETPTHKGTVAHGFIDVNCERFNYREVDWTLDKEKAANIAANASTIQGEFTSDISFLLEDVSLASPEIYSALLLNELDVPEIITSVVEDDFDVEKELEAIEDPKSQPGDIYQLGRHRLMCGDATKIEDLIKLMSGGKADLFLTDPPYNVNYEGATKDKLKILNDNKSDAEFRKFLVDAFTNANTFLNSGASFYIWHADTESYNFRGACIDADLHVRQCLIWNKNSLVMGRQDYQWKHEPCLYGWKTGKTHFWASDRCQTTVIDFNKPSKSLDHPTMKPIELFAYLLNNSTKKDDIVLDLFLGSGTTLIAAEQLNRACYGLELDPKYCDVIINRYLKFREKKQLSETVRK